MGVFGFLALMSDLARLLQQYGYGEQPNALAQDGVTYDTSNVLAGMPKKNALADALRIAMQSIPENKDLPAPAFPFDPRSLSMANMVRGGLDTAASWLDYQNKPQPSDYKASDVMGPLGAGFMGSLFAPKNALGIFGGRLAKTADHNALAAAEKMDANGVGRRMIWDATGWFKGKDGKWRFEIDDSKASLLPDAHTIPEKQSVPVQQAFVHPELFEAYPQLADYKYQHRPLPWPEVPGAHSGDHKTVLLNTTGRRFGDSEAGASTLLHELGGHGVQGVEGFAPGGNFKDFTPKEIAKERARLQALDEGSDWGSIGTFDSSSSDLDIARRLYRKLAGEVEARNVQTRQNMSVAERRRTPPWETQDVPDADQIIRKR